MFGQGPCTSCKTLVQTPAPRLGGGALVVWAELLARSPLRASRGGWVKMRNRSPMARVSECRARTGAAAATAPRRLRAEAAALSLTVAAPRRRVDRPMPIRHHVDA